METNIQERLLLIASLGTGLGGIMMLVVSLLTQGNTVFLALALSFICLSQLFHLVGAGQQAE